MSDYTVPALTRSEVEAIRDRDPRPADCRTCQNGYPVGHWPSPSGCHSSFHRNDSGTEVLFRVHCTCDRCF